VSTELLLLNIIGGMLEQHGAIGCDQAAIFDPQPTLEWDNRLPSKFINIIACAHHRVKPRY